MVNPKPIKKDLEGDENQNQQTTLVDFKQVVTQIK